MGNFKQHFYSVPIVLILLVTLYLLKDSHQHTETKQRKQHPGAVMEDVIAIRIDHNGHLQSKLHTPKMVLYPDQDRIEITTPKLEVFNEKGHTWEINAKRGESTQAVDHIDLWQNVKIEQPSGPYNFGSTLLTEKLSIFPAKKVASTEEKVTVTQPGITLQANGLTAHMETGHIQLHSNVEGKYEAKP